MFGARDSYVPVYSARVNQFTQHSPLDCSVPAIGEAGTFRFVDNPGVISSKAGPPACHEIDSWNSG